MNVKNLSLSLLYTFLAFPKAFQLELGEDGETPEQTKTFSLKNKSPTTRVGINTDEATIMFYSLPDPSNPDKYSNIQLGNLSSLRNAGLKRRQRFTIVTHGFTENAFIRNYTCQTLKDAYTSQGLYNLILMDWGDLATPTGPTELAVLGYPAIVFKNVPKAGARMKDFIQFLIESKFASGPESFHLVGMSLGAHVVGIAGRLTREAFGVKISRISGLDPAGPLYQLIGNKMKIDPSDGKFVDVIHTDIDAFGTIKPLGHVDFYSNGGLGRDQPNCPLSIEIPIVTEIVDASCGHTEAFRLFARSIRGEKLYGCKCQESLLSFFVFQCGMPPANQCMDQTLFGEHVPRSARGNFYLKNTGDPNNGNNS